MVKNTEICYNADIKNIGSDLLQIIGKIDVDKFRGISENIITDEVVLTERQIEHIESRHKSDLNTFEPFLAEIVQYPDYIYKDTKRPFTANILKTINENGKNIHLVLRLVTETDNDEYKNSIITLMRISEERLQNYIKNKPIVYKRE